jgi:hypothetical protein
MDSDGNLSGIGSINTTGTLSVTSIHTTGNIVADGTLTASNFSGSNTGDVTLTAVGSSPSANGASLSGQALTLQPADGTHPGVITSGAQTIGGNKTFSGSITASNLSGTNTGDQTITLTGEVTGSGTGSFATTLTNSAVIGKVLTGYTSGAGTVAATDTILQAIQKLNGNDATKMPLGGGTFTGAITGTSASFSSTVTGSNLSGTNTGDVTIGTANGLSLVGQALSMAAASSSAAGVLSTGSQSIAGTKTFKSPIVVGTGTLTLGGSVTTSGASALTLTTSGATNVTLPTSGTLATTTATKSRLRLETGNGHGSTNTVIRRYTTTVASVGSGTDYTYADSATAGMSVTINTAGFWAISLSDRASTGATSFGISVNSAQLTTSILSITNTARLAISQTGSGANTTTQIGTVVYLNANDVIRAHDDGGPDGTDARTSFELSLIFKS